MLGRRWPGALVIIVALVVASAVTINRLGAPPDGPPDYSGPRPAEAQAGYVAHSETVLVDVPAAQLGTVLDRLDLSDVIVQAEGLPEVVRTIALRGDWDPDTDRTGDRRRVELSDGHMLAEEVLVDTPATFRYMIWGFTTSPQRFAVDHAVGEFRYRAVGEQTSLTWAYSFHPRSALVRPFVRRFVDGEWAAMMRQTIDGMRAAAERPAE